MTPKPPRKKKCKQCGEVFQPIRSIQPVCDSYECKVKYAEAHANKAKTNRMKLERKKTREAKERDKSRSDWLSECQKKFNEFVRLRDKNQRCISCGQHSGAKMNAGHYRSVGACPELRFEPLNCHSQCEHCNSFLSGNIVEYRQRLILKIGIEQVEWIEGKHEPKNYSIEDIKALKAHYTQRCKELIKQQGE